jgi:hypothetical protein
MASQKPIISEEALADLDEIWSYIAQDSPTAAVCRCACADPWLLDPISGDANQIQANDALIQCVTASIGYNGARLEATPD